MLFSKNVLITKVLYTMRNELNPGEISRTNDSNFKHSRIRQALFISRISVIHTYLKFFSRSMENFKKRKKSLVVNQEENWI